MEKREKSRVPFNLNATFKYKGNSIEGELDNLSLNGLYIKTGEEIPEYSKIDVNIELSGDTSMLMIKIAGEVIRNDDNGIAIKFSNIDLDSFIHLKNIISYNMVNEDNEDKGT